MSFLARDMSTPVEPSLSVVCYNHLCFLDKLLKSFSSMLPVMSTLHNETYLNACLEIEELLEEVAFLKNDPDSDRALAVESVKSSTTTSATSSPDEVGNHVVRLHPCGSSSDTAVVSPTGCRPRRACTGRSALRQCKDTVIMAQERLSDHLPQSLAN